MKNISQKTLGILLAVLAFSIFSIADVCVKSTTMHYPPFSVALYMNLFTILFLIPVAWKVGNLKKVMRTKSLPMHIVRSYVMLGIFLSLIYAFGQLPIATVYVIVFATPFILNIMAMVILKEKISKHRWVSIVIALFGILIALRPDLITMGLGVLAAIISAFLNASSTICVKFIDKKDHWLSYILYQMLFQTPVLALVVLLQGNPLLPDFTNTSAMLPWFILGGIAYTLALSIIPQAIQRIDASLIGSLIYVVFPWGVLYGYFIFGDNVDRWTLIGASITIISGLYLVHREHLEHRKEKAEKT